MSTSLPEDAGEQYREVIAVANLGELGRIKAKSRSEPATSRSMPTSGPLESGESFELVGLALGSYDVWFEEANPYLSGEWIRVGPSRRIDLDLAHPSVEVDLTP
jgi:hypothetical protein